MTAQHPPINQTRLEEELEKKVLPPSKLIDEILSYGVDFDFDLAGVVEKELRDKHASDELIQAVHDSKLCNSVGRIIIAVVDVSEYEKNANNVHAALKKIGCPVSDPKKPTKPAWIDKSSKPIELRYFEESDSGLARRMADYIKRTTQVEIIPVPVQESIEEQKMPKKAKTQLDIYFLFKKEVGKTRGEH